MPGQRFDYQVGLTRLGQFCDGLMAEIVEAEALECGCDCLMSVLVRLLDCLFDKTAPRCSPSLLWFRSIQSAVFTSGEDEMVGSAEAICI